MYFFINLININCLLTEEHFNIVSFSKDSYVVKTMILERNI